MSSTNQSDPGRRGSPAARPDRLDRRALLLGWTASAVLHAAVLVGFGSVAITVPADRSRGVTEATGPADREALVALRITVAPSPLLPSPRPPLAVAEPQLVAAATPAPSLRLPAPAGLELPPVAGRGGRLEAGTAPGPGSDPAETPPVPRSVFPEWDPPAALRGIQVTVRVRVDATGRPTGEVELVPPTPDPAFNRRLRERAVRMEYLPARSGGVPVAGWAEITFVF